MTQPASSVAFFENETLVRLIDLTNDANLYALDQTVNAVKRAHVCYIAAAARTASIAERIERGVYELGMCLPPEARAQSAVARNIVSRTGRA